MIASRHWQDWATTVVGALVGLSPLAFTSTWTDSVAYAAYILGGLVFVIGALKLFLPEATYFEWVQIVLAVVLFFSPWLIGFTAVTAMAWTAWLAAVAIVLAVGSLYLEAPRPLASAS